MSDAVSGHAVSDDIRLSGLFTADAAGRLLIGGRPAADLVDEAGDTPLFVYDAGIVDRHIARLRAAMPADIELHYAIKANPFAPLLRHVAGLVDGLDIASAGELDMALTTGTNPADISFAGPGKRDRELMAAIAAGVTLNIESAGELDRAIAIAARQDRPLRAALRINPPFDLKGSGMRMGGGAKPFGVDADLAPALLERMHDADVEFRGFHVFAGSQNLNADALIEAQRQTVALIADLAEHAPVPPPTANIGGGFGLPYFPGDVPLDIERIGDALAATLAARPDGLRHTRFILELGRYLVGDCGVYLTRIVDRKLSGDQTYLVTDGGLHHQLAASGNFGTVI
ncbi:MAG: alanine racemase, partial [Pseudomonadota bacterium]